MFRILLLLFGLAFWGEPSSEEELGCLTTNNWTYCPTLQDYEWFSKALYCEAGNLPQTDEMPAVGWTLLHRFYQARTYYPTLSIFLQEYCQCLNPEWGSGGNKRTSRDIVQRVDKMRALRLLDLPYEPRSIARGILKGEIADLWPTFVHFLAGGSERFASDGRIGPFYVSPGPNRNAFYADSRSIRWAPAPVGIVSRETYRCRQED